MLRTANHCMPRQASGRVEPNNASTVIAPKYASQRSGLRARWEADDSRYFRVASWAAPFRANLSQQTSIAKLLSRYSGTREMRVASRRMAVPPLLCLCFCLDTTDSAVERVATSGRKKRKNLLYLSAAGGLPLWWRSIRKNCLCNLQAASLLPPTPRCLVWLEHGGVHVLICADAS